MKYAATILFACGLLAFAAPAAALTPHSPVFIDADAAQTVTVSPGEEFFIALPSDAATGLAWTSSVGDEKIVAYEGNVPQRPSASARATSGQQLFIFHANRSGTTTIAFAYVRSFESGASPAKALTFNVAVR